MKIFVIVFFFSCAYRALSQSTACSPNCRDYTARPQNCALMRNNCNNVFVRTFCMRTCRTCTPCENLQISNTPTRTEPEGCEIETCMDRAPLEQCVSIKHVIPNGCALYPQSCRLSCKQCKPCSIPKPKKSCSTNCSDHEPNGTCRYWKQQGYCNQTDLYPTILQVCPLSCGACKLCPTEPPTPPRCSHDCHDTLGDCSYWKQQGHCNEGSEYPYTREVCKKSCGVCVFCPRDAGLSTALPPPREEIENDENESEQS